MAVAAALPETDTSNEVVFRLEGLGAAGLPRAEKTMVEFSGFVLEGPIQSVVSEEESLEPSTWLFLSAEARAAEAARKKAEEEAAKNPKSAKGKAPVAPDVPDEPPVDFLRIARPCSSENEKQQVLDGVSSPLKIALMTTRDSKPLVLGTASASMSDLAHDTSSVELLSLVVQWTPEYVAILRQEHDEKVAAAAAARAAELEAQQQQGGEGGGEDGEEPPEEPPAEVFEDPAPGQIKVRVSSAAPIARVFYPEDLEDWTVVTVKLEGCYRLPEKLLQVGPGGKLPEETVGVVADHPLSYSLRFLGCSFNGGQLVMPEIPPAPEEQAGVETGNPQEQKGAEGGQEGEEGQQQEGQAEEGLSFDVGPEEFVEALVRAGFLRAKEDGPTVFEHLMRPRTGLGGKLGHADFCRLADFQAPASSATLRKFRTFLLSQGEGGLEEAWNRLSPESEFLAESDLTSTLEGLSYDALEAIPELFSSLDSLGSGAIASQELGLLDLEESLSQVVTCEKLQAWLLQSFPSLNLLWKHLDEAKAGKISLDSWKGTLQKLGYTSAQDCESLFKLLDAKDEGVLKEAHLELLPLLTLTNVESALSELEACFGDATVEGEKGGEAGPALAGMAPDLDRAFARLLQSSQEEAEAFEAEEPAWLTWEAFEAACKKLNFGPTIGFETLFSLLATHEKIPKGEDADAEAEAQEEAQAVDEVQKVFSKRSLLSVFQYCTAKRRGKIAACQAFITRAFPNFTAAFKRLFDFSGEEEREAELTLPRIEWPTAIVRAYRGRVWMQRLFNSLGDDRGRLCVDPAEAEKKGSWLYFFPTLVGQAAPVDYKTVTEPAAVVTAQVARWHHGQAFVDLRRLSSVSDPRGESKGPSLDFCAYLTQVGSMPSGINDTGDLPAMPFGGCMTFIKGTISFDRPFERLCPRNILPLPQVGELPLLPPRPKPKPPPTVVEELEFEAKKIVGKLSVDFARLCHDKGLEEDQIVGVKGDVAEYKLLGKRGLQEHAFLNWLKEDGETWQALSAELRPAIVRMIRSEAPDGPSCGLDGNESDARYSSMRDMVLEHLFKALNEDIRSYKKRRDTAIWRSSVEGAGTDLVNTEEDPGFVKPDRVLEQQEKHRDKELRRLAFEYEALGDYQQVVRLYSQLLELPSNKQNSEVWLRYARFWMRWGQKQPEALDALRHAVSFRPEEEGPTLQEAAFIAFLLQNHTLPCSLEGAELTPTERFEAACSILENYADKHPGEQMPLYLLFVVYAHEAYAIEVESSFGEGPPPDPSEIAAVQRLQAKATKYLELARAGPSAFAGTLCEVTFPELEALSLKERLSRGEATQPLETLPPVPEAWNSDKFPVFTRKEDVHRDPKSSDKEALSVIDMMLSFGTSSYVPFLLTAASEVYGFLSPDSTASERCRLQLVKAHMLSENWDLAIGQLEDLFETVTDRIPVAHALLGECHYRKALLFGDRSSQTFAASLAAFSNALLFFDDLDDRMTTAKARLTSKASAKVPGEKKARGGDLTLHLRVASIYYRIAEESGFQDEEAMRKTIEHYKRSLEVTGTAEAWHNAGICHYRLACNLPRGLDGSEAMHRRQGLLRDALRFFTEANLLNRNRPQVNAWLVICSVELGMVNIAKQTFRQVLRCASDLDCKTAIELAEVLLNFSNEAIAATGERVVLVEDGRYVSEALAIGELAVSAGGGEKASSVVAAAETLREELRARSQGPTPAAVVAGSASSTKNEEGAPLIAVA